MAKANLTSAGLLLLTNAQGGNDTITFTKMAVGDGKLDDTPIASLTALVSQKAEMPITQKKIVKTGTFQIGAYFSNTDITVGFYWRETGIFAKGNDGKEILYCYVNVGDVTDYISVATDKRIEKYIYQSLTVGDSTNISIQVNESEMFITEAEKGVSGGVAPLDDGGKVPTEHLPEMNYVANEEYSAYKKEVDAHIDDKSNIHQVTKEQVGLGEVPNVSTNNQTPTYTEATSLTNLTSGEKLSIAFGKIKKAITELISHLSNKNNPHKVTAAQTGALPLSGGTVTGDLLSRAFIQLPNAYGMPNEIGQYLDMHKEGSTADYDMRLLVGSDNSPRISRLGTGEKALFGEHNKPTGSYSGVGVHTTPRAIAVGGIGSGLLVWSKVSGTTNGGSFCAFVTPYGGFMNNQGSLVVFTETTMSFSNGQLVIGGHTQASIQDALNQTYYYQVL